VLVECESDSLHQQQTQFIGDARYCIDVSISVSNYLFSWNRTHTLQCDIRQ